MNVYFLHGFLGLPSDWVPTLDDMHKDPKFDAHVHLMNLWRTIEDTQVETMFEDWATEFSKELQGEDNWLVGYSLGGRLPLNLPTLYILLLTLHDHSYSLAIEALFSFK